VYKKEAENSPSSIKLNTRYRYCWILRQWNSWRRVCIW